MNKQLYKDVLGWGFLIWFIGYILGFVFFTILSASIIGWAIMPIGIIVTLLILYKKIKSDSFRHYVLIAISWTLIAITLDYLLIVKVLKPADGYYKLDVYLYYILTFAIPLLVGWRKTKIKSSNENQ